MTTSSGSEAARVIFTSLQFSWIDSDVSKSSESVILHQTRFHTRESLIFPGAGQSFASPVSFVQSEVLQALALHLGHFAQFEMR